MEQDHNNSFERRNYDEDKTVLQQTYDEIILLQLPNKW